jgi:dTDP-4-dehydrorhamnose 3,5-epimerase
MEIKTFPIEGLIEIIPTIYSDSRGNFFEPYNLKTFENLGIRKKFLQDNQSFSKAGVIRGLHFQKAPYAQAKLVRVVLGKALDVVVDLRKHSPTFGQVCYVELSSEKNNSFYIPEGFAHGFAALTDCIFLYKVSELYNKESESGIHYADPDLNINWGVEDAIVSEKDLVLPSFKNSYYFS